MFTIRQLTREFDVTARTLRFYEEEKLIAPARRGQTRLYTARDHARIASILRGRRLGLSIAQLRELLGLEDAATPAQIQAARQTFAARIATLECQRRDIEDSLADMRRALDALDSADRSQAA